MRFFTSDIRDYNIQATDGEMGKVKDLYFDDTDWTIRYAVVDTRKWLPGRKVLLAPSSFTNLNETERQLEVEYDKDTVKNSPAIPEGQDITAEAENSLIGYYGWSRYWLTSSMWDVDNSPITSTFDQAESLRDKAANDVPVSEDTSHNLRSDEETTGFKVHANNGKVGTVADMIFDDEDWKIQQLVIQSSESYIEERYLLAVPEEIESVDWYEKDIYLDIPLETVNQKQVYPKKADILVER
ncbi:PRC-barrel domain-containing protein [Virgibacillus xinjiangensis]|uniref:PRC-barrel domain-containing protein n=1 Tax=Virgibacillus xinjiangensis TaxID=393090 RepID=A0ABV7CQW6_9BACI